jgi:hypothetical protein
MSKRLIFAIFNAVMLLPFVLLLAWLMYNYVIAGGGAAGEVAIAILLVWWPITLAGLVALMVDLIVLLAIAIRRRSTTRLRWLALLGVIAILASFAAMAKPFMY